MSGGEKALVLCMLVWQRPNLLLMDEPTNHLDLATREALSMALNEFEGTVMLVSHDPRLCAPCDEFWMVSRAAWRLTTATWTTTSATCSTKPAPARSGKEYLTSSRWQTGCTRPPCAPANKANPDWDRLTQARKEFDEVEARMTTLNTEGASLEGQLASNTHPTRSPRSANGSML